MSLKHYLTTISYILSSLLFVSGCATPSKNFAEIAAPELDIITMVRVHRNNQMIVLYNPDVCEQIGKACGFFRSQAHAHIVLLHPVLPPESYPISMLRQADCWAAKYTDTEEVVAAVNLLSDPNLHEGLPIAGDPKNRARHIQSCAEENGNW